MIASRLEQQAFNLDGWCTVEQQGRLWQVRIGDITVCGVYLPNGRAKLPYWDIILDLAKTNTGRAMLFIGDFNTGRNDLDKDAGGTPFIGATNMHRMDQIGQFDLFRTIQGERREYSWFSPKGNGFRLDHAFGNQAIRDRLINCYYDHTARQSGITDHSALIVDLEITIPDKL